MALNTSILQTIFPSLTLITRSTFGHDFFRQCTTEIGQTLGLYGVSIGQVISDHPKDVRVLALYFAGTAQKNFTYRAFGTPCDEVLKGETIYCPQRAMAQYPEDEFFRQHGIESYLGVPIINPAGKVVGELCVFDTKAMPQDVREALEFTLSILAGRAGFEMERIEIEENYRTTLDRLDLAIRGSSDGLWEALVPKDHTWMSEKTEVWFSPRFKGLLGYSDSEFENSVLNFFDHLHPEDRQKVIEAIDSHLIHHRPYDIDYRLRTKSGNFRWFNARGRAIWDANGLPLKFAGSLRDITVTRSVQEALIQSEEKFRQFADNIQQVFWMNDPISHEMLFISKAYETVWEKPCEELYARPTAFLDRVHPDDIDRVHTYVQNQTKGPASAEYRLVMDNGQIKWINDRSFPVMDKHNQVYRICGFAENITLRKKLEDQLLQAEKMQAIGTLAGGLAHDFNNMLGGILGNAEIILLRTRKNSPLHDFARAIERSAKRAADLTQQILHFARSGRHEFKPFDVHACVQEALASFCRNPRHKIRFRLKLRAKAALLRGDSSQVQQLIYNLVVNAVDAINAVQPTQGEVLLTTKNVRLRRSARYRGIGLHKGRYICLTVKDNGCGIPDTIRSRIFDPFFTTKNRAQGTGMGLSTAYSIAKSHAGMITVRSEAQKGSTFFVYLPLSPTIEAAINPSPKRTSIVRGKGNILLIEDQNMVRLTAERQLREIGYRVISAGSAEEGIRILEHDRKHFDLVIMDWIMPGMDGKECFLKIKEIAPHLPAIITTGLDPLAHRKDFLKFGFSALLPKPFQISTLSHTLARVLKTPKHRAEKKESLSE